MAISFQPRQAPDYQGAARDIGQSFARTGQAHLTWAQAVQRHKARQEAIKLQKEQADDQALFGGISQGISLYASGKKAQMAEEGVQSRFESAQALAAKTRKEDVDYRERTYKEKRAERIGDAKETLDKTWRKNQAAIAKAHKEYLKEWEYGDETKLPIDVFAKDVLQMEWKPEGGATLAEAMRFVDQTDEFIKGRDKPSDNEGMVFDVKKGGVNPATLLATTTETDSGLSILEKFTKPEPTGVEVDETEGVAVPEKRFELATGQLELRTQLAGKQDELKRARWRPLDFSETDDPAVNKKVMILQDQIDLIAEKLGVDPKTNEPLSEEELALSTQRVGGQLSPLPASYGGEEQEIAIAQAFEREDRRLAKRADEALLEADKRQEDSSLAAEIEQEKVYKGLLDQRAEEARIADPKGSAAYEEPSAEAREQEQIQERVQNTAAEMREETESDLANHVAKLPESEVRELFESLPKPLKAEFKKTIADSRMKTTPYWELGEMREFIIKNKKQLGGSYGPGTTVSDTGQ